MQTLEELIPSVTELVIRDLKLDDVELDADTPLNTGELDLDSLDFLMLVASIDKAYGIKIPNHQLGPQTFQSIRVLATVVYNLMQEK